MNKAICQSCSLPMDDKEYGTNKDNTKTDKFCKYCYENGEFSNNYTLKEEVEFLIPMYIDGRDMSIETARKELTETLSKLSRWK